MIRRIREWIQSVKDAFAAHATTVQHIVVEHSEYRTQIFQLANADVIKTYRGSALGWMWAVIKPTVTIFVYWFAFSFGLRAGQDVNGYPFFLWLIAGIIPWFYMSEMLTQGSQRLKRYDYLVTKIKFPVSTISTFVSLSKLYVHCALLLVVVTIFVLFGYGIDIYVIQLPLYMGLMFVFFTAWSLFSSPLSAVSQDFANTINSFVTAIFWMSGIMWDVNQIESPLLKKLLWMNPVTFVATGYRNVFIYKRWFFEDTYSLLVFSLMLLGMFALSVFTYGRLRSEIADVL
jgi:teichoic acid transport system permease protein